MRFRPAALALLLLASCSETAEDPNLVALRDANELCKAQLAAADYEQALFSANETLGKSNVVLADAKLADELRFCRSLAKTFGMVNESSTFIQQFTEAMSDLFNARQAGAPYETQAGTLESTILDNVLTAVLVPAIEDLEDVAATFETIAARPGFSWETERLPVMIAGRELFDAAGAYDTGEVEILRGLLGSVLGTLYTLQSLDYRVNIPAIIEYAKLAESPLKNYEAHPVAGIMNAGAVLLGTAPNFMALKDKDGEQWAGKAGATYTAAVKSLLDAAAFIKARQGDQADHVIEYQRADDQDYFVVHLQFNTELSPDLQVDLEKFDDTSIPLREDVLASLTRVYESLEARGGKRAGVQGDIFPIMALVGVVALKSGALDASLNQALDEIDPDLAAKLRATFEYGQISQESFLQLMITAVPVQMEMDLGRGYKEPAGLRELLPAWKQPDPKAEGGFAMAAFTEATFVVEYECENPLLTGSKAQIFCADPVDAPHFGDAGAAWPWKNQASDNLGPKWQGAIAKDNIASRGPYIGFKDPTFGGALYVDYTTSNVPKPGSADVDLANQAALNALLATMTEAVLTVYAP